MTLRVGLYSPWDTEDPRSWSGVVKPMADGLRSVMDVEVIPAVTASDALGERVRARLRGAAGGRSLPTHTMATAARRSRALARSLQRRSGPPLAALVAIAASTDVLSLPEDLPLVQITDATFPALLGFYPMATGLGPRGERQGRAVERAGAARTSRYVVASDWAAESLIHDVGVEPQRILTAAFGPAIAAPPHPAARRVDGPLRVLAVAADWKRKRGGAVVEAVAMARVRRDVDLTVVGSAPADLPRWVAAPGLVPQERLAELYASHDVLLDLSAANAAGVVMTDALVSGLPVIAHRAGGVESIVADGRTGWLVGPRGSTEAAGALLARLTPDDVAAASESALLDAGRRLTWDAWALQVREAVEAAVAESAGAAA
ncbi:glycosyltransferase family 4 protein [Kocuria palustris]|uniref:glycosyltransferase family 4 protein n=1 Tax=Kocuria palustris TaxID=71999 RepID=UPI001642F7D6|nr:glycosyltransferase family 4 protein [Kocuria palustris]